MIRLWFERWRAVGLPLLFLLLTGTIVVTATPREGPGGFINGVQSLFAPLQGLLTAAADMGGSIRDHFTSVARHQRERQELLNEIQALRVELQQMQEAARENEWLRRMLGLELRTPFALQPAAVIGRSPGEWFGLITIDKGRRDGVREGLPVIGSAGVVGRVYHASNRTARVMLIVDADSSLGGLVQRSGQPVLVQGIGMADGRLRVNPLSQEARLQPGDVILTSGLSRLYPRGLPIGAVEEVVEEAHGRAWHAYLRPFTDFNRMEWVSVILNPATAGLEVLEAESGAAEDAQAEPEDSAEAEADAP